MMTRMTGLAGAVAALVTLPVTAHHGFGTFAMNEDIVLTGTITGLDFVNPHSWLHMDVVTASGAVEAFRCELRSATTLRRSGWSPDMFPVGTQITVEGVPDRTDDHACYTSTLIWPDGTTIDRYGQRIEAEVEATRPARLADNAPNISGDWAVEQRVMTDPQGRDGTLVRLSTVDEFEVGGVPEGGREIPGARGTPEAETIRAGFVRPLGRPSRDLTAAGQVAWDAMAEVPRSERSCLQNSIVSDWGGEPVNRIVQRGETISVLYGNHGLERTVYLNLDAHPEGISASRAGHSIGHWEGDTLVVDTIGFAPGRLNGSTPHSDQLHVTERFSLGEDGASLRRDYVAEDPAFFVGQLEGGETMMLSSVPYAPEPCADLTPVEVTQ